MKRLYSTLLTLCASGALLLAGGNAVAQGCLNDWQFQMPITIDNSGGGALTDYEILVTINTQAQVSQGRMDSNGDDIRFTDGTCCNQLCFYIESAMNTDTTKIWVNIPSIGAGATETINLMFGNNGATNASDPACTFAFWDGFDDSLATRFDPQCGNTTYTINGGNLDLNWSSSGILISKDTLPVSNVYTLEADVNGASGTWPAVYWAEVTSKENYGMMINATQARISVKGGGTDWCSGHNWASTLSTYSSVQGIWSLTWEATASQFGNFPSVGAMTSTDATYVRDEDMRIMIGGISSGTGNINIDWIRARQYTPTPPTATVGNPGPFNAGPALDLGADDTLCGPYGLDAGSGYTSYVWSTGDTVQTTSASTSGTYSVTVTDAEGCVQVDSIGLQIGTIYSLSDSMTVCAGDTVTFADGTTQVMTASTQYTSMLQTVLLGCDSTITTDVTVNDVDNTTSTVGITITSNETDTSATYQWVSCPSMTPINGETGSSYTATADGDYAVVVTANGCTETSPCVTIIGVGITEANLGSLLKVYPNPTDGDFTIDLGTTHEETIITLTNATGKVVAKENFNSGQLINMELNEPSGIYFLEVIAGDQRAAVRVVKQ